MERDCLAKRNLILHYHGTFQEAPDGSLYSQDNYRGGVMEKMRNVDGDRINFMDLVDDIKENYLFDISVGFEILYTLNSEKVYVKNDNDLMQMWANMEEDIRGWSHVFVELEGEIIELVETMIMPTPKCRKPTKNVKKMSTRRRSITKNKSSIKDNDDFYSKKCIGTLDDSDGEDDWNQDLPPITPLSSGPQADISPPPPHTTNASTPHISGPSFISDSTTPISHAPTPFSPPPPPPPRPIDEIEDDEGYMSTHSSEDEEDHVIAIKVDFVDFIVGTDNIIDIDEGSEQSVNKPLIWEVGMEWPNIDVLRDDIKDFCIGNRFAGDLIKNDPLKIRVVCLGEDKKKVQCPWVAYFRRDEDGFTMRLNTLKPIYTCHADCDMLNRMANANWVVKKIQDQMKVHFKTMTPVFIKEEVMRVFHVNISYWTAWNARIKSLQQIYGDYEENYNMIPVLCNMAVRVLLPRRVEWVEYYSSYFWVSEYKLTYTSNVKPMKDVKDWLKPDPTKHVKPPPLVRGIGRPRKERMRAKDENGNENGHVQKKRKMTCSKCKGEGHNARSCKGLAASEVSNNGSNGSNAKKTTLRLKPKPWTRSRTVTGESTVMDREKKIVRKTQSGIKKAKYKALRNDSDTPASDAPASDAPPSDPIAEPPSNAPVRVAPPRHEHLRKSQSNGHTFFKAPEHRHTMGDLIMKQGEGQNNSTSVLHADHKTRRGEKEEKST
ncbi:hypothetical protein IFM89_025997 [Coptis chinensis]|uniref:Transposase MuDR plant domain-containing protein n=1 Tax=Coptis chinensis TaxID=261450 RepID=A0A835LX89_9MAGN|nr:hypothetical protein IFM89_025997 [Coptis chinensis]